MDETVSLFSTATALKIIFLCILGILVGSTLELSADREKSHRIAYSKEDGWNEHYTKPKPRVPDYTDRTREKPNIGPNPYKE